MRGSCATLSANSSRKCMRRNTLSSLRFALVSSEQGEFCGRPLNGKRRAYNACSSSSHKAFASQNLCGIPVSSFKFSSRSSSFLHLPSQTSVQWALAFGGQDSFRLLRRLRSGNGTLHVPFPSSKAVKATPWLCQESAFSPSNSPQKNTASFFGDPEEGGKGEAGPPLK